MFQTLTSIVRFNSMLITAAASVMAILEPTRAQPPEFPIDVYVEGTPMPGSDDPIDHEVVKSLDGRVELTIDEDGLLHAVNNHTMQRWQFPPRDHDVPQAKHHKTAFIPANTGFPKNFRAPDPRTLYVLYGNMLYCLNGDNGNFIWTNQLADEAPEEASFKFDKQNVVVTIGDEARMFKMLTGKELR